MNTTARYVMDPAEDTILFGDELREGMWVLADDPLLRRPHGDSEEDRIRRQRFRRVTRLRHGGPMTVFIGEWVDGYQETHRYATSYGWIVKREESGEEVAGDGTQAP